MIRISLPFRGSQIEPLFPTLSSRFSHIMVA